MNGAKKVSCLGPAGSYSHLAAETLCPGSEVLLKNNFPAVFASLAEGELSRDYIIPSPFDRSVAPAVAKAVAEQAKKEGLARI